MIIADNTSKYDSLRNMYSFFVYEGFEVTELPDSYTISFMFNMSDKEHFRPTLTIPKNESFNTDIMSDEKFENIIFHLGMIEMLSYWKTACCPLIIIKNYKLDIAQLAWWRKIYYYGLGEFFYINGINPDYNTFVKFQCEGVKELEKTDFKTLAHNLIPMGGGKDSAVTFDILSKAGHKNCIFFLNPQHVPVKLIEIDQYDYNKIVAYRAICPNLLTLNAKGFLNGHTPFSAVLAFISLLIAGLNGIRYIVLSNESSANEATVEGTKINHQYSKTLEFESDFRNYVVANISDSFEYFSFMRPLNELQIAGLFSRSPYFFDKFRSCNVGSKKGIWCCRCPKCLFTYIILSPFITPSKLKKIFGENLLEVPDLSYVFKQLTGQADTKPFECVGTIDDVNMALVMALRNEMFDKPLPLLMNEYIKSDKYLIYKGADADLFLSKYDSINHLPSKYETLLREALKNFKN